ncbi:MAG: hypothetical protein CM1200mP22_09480 [Dehalococcoidia bacterium]|nr:MAG: hypothetical protein CM1200mP22_09480 [Dehalococcoidia bacterium]
MLGVTPIVIAPVATQEVNYSEDTGPRKMKAIAEAPIDPIIRNAQRKVWSELKLIRNSFIVGRPGVALKVFNLDRNESV